MLKAVAFDIDGVILLGGKVIPGAKEAVEKLIISKTPDIFITNGGGTLEEQKAKDLSKKLDLNITKNQIIVCHTPYQELVQSYADSYVLVLGHKGCVDVAKSYGFNKVITPEDYYHSCPGILPVRGHKESVLSSTPELIHPSAAFVFHDPVDWSLDMQVLNDVLVEKSENGEMKQRIPMFACNADIVYATEYHSPRFTQGAFVEAFRHLFEINNKIPLQLTYFGKPYEVQYKFAEHMLQEQAKLLGYQIPPTHFYGIGDNPKSDVRGANGAGDAWSSILVRTGLFKSTSGNDLEDPADYVCNNVLDAIETVVLKN